MNNNIFCDNNSIPVSAAFGGVALRLCSSNGPSTGPGSPSSFSMSIDTALFRNDCVVVSTESGGSEGGTEIISTSSFWLECTSDASKSDARLFNGDEDLCGRSAAPPIIDLCENKRIGDWPLVSNSFGARELL